MADRRRLLVACGILRREIASLVEKNLWPVEALFLDSALHVEPAALHRRLGAALARAPGPEAVVVYGCCHPGIDALVEGAGATRTPGQNCIELLLGPERFAAELEAGAFFLLEEWARRWEHILGRAFGTNWEVVREIFQGAHGYLLALRTPFSGDFRAEAEAAGRRVGLPVRWAEAGLEHLEAVLGEALATRTGDGR